MGSELTVWDYQNYAPEFTVFTDQNPLTHVLTTAKLNTTGLHWVGELSDFNFNMKYRSGESNTDADSLSQLRELFWTIHGIMYSNYLTGRTRAQLGRI